MTAASYALPIDTAGSTEQYESATNRLKISLMDYDAAGNQKTDVLGQGYTYVGENRVRAALNGQLTYSYDGEGRRVRKDVGTTSTTVYVYGASGEMVAE